MERQCSRESQGLGRRAQESGCMYVVVGCPPVSSAAELLRSLDTWRKLCAEQSPLVPSSVAALSLGRRTTRPPSRTAGTQVSRMKWHLLTTLLVLLTMDGAEALREPEICYVLDGILFFYGIILTFLYCRLKIQYRKKSKAGPSPIYEKVEGVYTGLTTREPETYTTLELPKRTVSEHPSSKPSEIQYSVVE